MYGYIEKKCGKKLIAKQTTNKNNIPREVIERGFWDVLHDKKGHSQQILDGFIEYFGLKDEDVDFIVDAYFSSNCSFAANGNSDYVAEYPQDFAHINGVNFNVHF